MVREDDVARLLATEREIAPDHLLHHVLVSHRTSEHLDAALAQRNLETDVAHDGSNHRVSFELALRLQLARAHQQHGVAVDDLAVSVDEDCTIAIAVKGDAQPALLLANRMSKMLGVR